jgi:hypothetical protein
MDESTRREERRGDGKKEDENVWGGDRDTEAKYTLQNCSLCFHTHIISIRREKNTQPGSLGIIYPFQSLPVLVTHRTHKETSAHACQNKFLKGESRARHGKLKNTPEPRTRKKTCAVSITSMFEFKQQQAARSFASLLLLCSEQQIKKLGRRRSAVKDERLQDRARLFEQEELKRSTHFCRVTPTHTKRDQLLPIHCRPSSQSLQNRDFIFWHHRDGHRGEVVQPRQGVLQSRYGALHCDRLDRPAINDK